jgi:hypothetical protein
MDERNESRGLTRGGLIKAGAVAAAVAGVGGAGRALAAGGAEATPAASSLGRPVGGPAYLRHETFVRHVGSDFRFHRPEARTLRLKLIEARRAPSAGESFSLLFHGRTSAGVDAGTYRIEHPTLGNFELFASPVGRGVDGLHLEAVVNRITTGRPS